jgi:glycerol-3-phosphate dehydrogenase (NAD(P)+)
MPAAAVIGFADLAVAERMQPLFSTPYFRAYTTDDVAGVELGGALKNIYAIAAGVSDGLGFGDNSKAALVTRALVELVRLGVVLGGRRETFYGLSGMGDLTVTCFSRHSRNRGLGERLGRGESLEEITAGMTGIAEGVPTTRSAFECARRADVSTPIIDQVHAMLFSGKPPRTVLLELMSRDPRPE